MPENDVRAFIAATGGYCFPERIIPDELQPCHRQALQETRKVFPALLGEQFCKGFVHFLIRRYQVCMPEDDVGYQAVQPLADGKLSARVPACRSGAKNPIRFGDELYNRFRQFLHGEIATKPTVHALFFF